MADNFVGMFSRGAGIGAGKVLVFVLACLPLLFYAREIGLLLSGQAHGLGADPGKLLVQEMGVWALGFLIVTLTITPARRISGWHWLARYRRLMGLFCFFYASLHLLAFLTFILEWRWTDVLSELRERPYILVGFSAFLVLIPLALTSTRSMMRRLGRKWVKLHQWVYVAAVLAVCHLIWLTRADYSEPLFFGSVVVILLGYRLFYRLKKPNGSRAVGSPVAK